jgi:hypothetical protein
MTIVSIGIMMLAVIAYAIDREFYREFVRLIVVLPGLLGLMWAVSGLPSPPPTPAPPPPERSPKEPWEPTPSTVRLAVAGTVVALVAAFVSGAPGSASIETKWLLTGGPALIGLAWILLAPSPGADGRGPNPLTPGPRDRMLGVVAVVAGAYGAVLAVVHPSSLQEQVVVWFWVPLAAACVWVVAPRRLPRSGQVRLALVIAGLAALSAFVIRPEEFWGYGVYFVGVPAAFAILLSLLPRPEGTRARIGRATTIGIVVSAIVVRELFICVLMIAPLIYTITRSMARAREHGEERGSARVVVLAILVLILSFEGLLYSFSDDHTAQASAIVPLPAAEVESRLMEAPVFDGDPSWFLRLGFPRPVHATGFGLNPGSPRTVVFNDGSHLTFVVVERAPNRIRFESSVDTTTISRWAEWTASEVEWHAVDEGRTIVRWKIEFQRHLAPAAYFMPLQWFGMREAAAYLIDSTVAP